MEARQMRKVYRNGDLPIVSTKEKIIGKKVTHNGNFVLALGEKTNHRHLITAERPQDMVIYDLGNGCWLLDLKTQAKISHEEHKTIVLEPQKYIVGREREYDYFQNAARKVID